MEFEALLLVRDRAWDETQVVASMAVKFIEGSNSVAITAAAKGSVKAGKFGQTVRV